ncbi:class I SAM-dependent methyltransferase [Pseudomonas sp. 5P_3.1_Bac2]|uniref:class I SAM-dependent methyltransferase n=1 Tax=Pseudomonas sp. 5P_3.1_Bac2 TaxID=2971617 RepID=UPI0021C93B17|nr:class I SAM-dependent methyltransferase [Pseudomonas sp. 5P_3.1_Bac2]MCU1719055.1 class I SAM-dependent methyltransferase [Pseudomonas sp. 5P_3.1_Bac2]
MQTINDTTSQHRHDVLVQMTHDEEARQDFVRCFKLYLAQNVSPGNKKVFTENVEPQLKATGKGQSLVEIDRLMKQQEYYQFWSSLQRCSQEMMWNSVQIPVQRQLPTLVEKASAAQAKPKLGSLKLNLDLKTPEYHTAIDIHCMPGGYHSEFCSDDVAAGAIYDRAVYVYAMGRMGPLNDDIGASTAKWLKEHYPDFKPQRILDLGCTVGHSTLAWAEYYPQAQIFAIDVGAPVLRYAHARAESLGVKVNFIQMNAEALDFPDGYFDVVNGSILIHETSKKAASNIFKESHRVLREGGVMLHGETPPYKDLPPYDAFMLDWDTRNNNEPFWRGSHLIDPFSACAQAGFSADKVFEILAPSAFEAKLSQRYTHVFQGGDFGGGGQWYVYGAWK